jgi:hypothetical protein
MERRNSMGDMRELQVKTINKLRWNKKEIKSVKKESDESRRDWKKVQELY